MLAHNYFRQYLICYEVLVVESASFSLLALVRRNLEVEL
ncbi:hypothetical protein BH20ACI3_BH20ACI3_04080 [soil metagenome]